MEQLLSTEIRQIYSDFLKWEWSEPEDFMRKYGPQENPEDWNRLGNLFSIYERIGVLYKEGVFNINMLFDMAGTGPIRVWEKFEPFADYYRLNYEVGVKGMWWEYFEYLAYALLEVREIDRKHFEQRYQRRKHIRAKYGKTIPEYNR